MKFIRRYVLPALPNATTLIGGSALIASQYGWKAGLGLGMLFWFVKAPE